MCKPKPISPEFVKWLEMKGKFHLCLDEIDELVEQYETEIGVTDCD